jgi:molecular chaperone GrpE
VSEQEKHAEAAEAAPQATDDTRAQLETARAEAQTNLEGWQRARAEFANYKRRVDREMTEAYQKAAADVMKSWLPVMDDFEYAASNVKDTLKDDPWVGGVLAIRRKFDKVLEQYNVTTVGAVGDAYNPALHEAIGEDEAGDVPSGHITVVMRRGYISGETVLRPALVRVAR